MTNICTLSLDSLLFQVKQFFTFIGSRQESNLHWLRLKLQELFASSSAIHFVILLVVQLLLQQNCSPFLSVVSTHHPSLFELANNFSSSPIARSNDSMSLAWQRIMQTKEWPCMCCLDIFYVSLFIYVVNFIIHCY